MHVPYFGEKRVHQKISIRGMEAFTNDQHSTHLVHNPQKRVADANNDNTAQNKYIQRFLLEFSDGFATYNVGDDFFNSLVQYIADQTKLDYVFIGELVETHPEKFSIKTFALTAFGKKAPNIEYPLPDGPCEQVIRGMLYAYPNECGQIFPKNQTIAEFNVEGYIGYPLFDVKGNALGLIAVMHQKAIEDPDYISSLLKIVAKRTEFELERIKHEIELVKINKDLEDKNRELENRNAELASFSYVASHDLQEPFRKIETFSSRLIEKDEANISELGKEYLKRIQKAAFRAQKLINDLLLYSRTNTSEKHFTDVDLNTLLATIQQELRETISEKNASIQFNVLPILRVIEFQFHQLFTNLITNSLKFCKPGVPPQIIISAEVVLPEQISYKQLYSKYCKIEFKDNGIGFEDQYAEKIFSIFQRLHSREEYEGTGIGLTICRKIVENHDGFITAVGTPGKGAAFSIFIPVEN